MRGAVGQSRKVVKQNLLCRAQWKKCSPKFDSLVDAVRYLAEDLRNGIVHKIHSVTCGSREIDLRKFRRCVMMWGPSRVWKDEGFADLENLDDVVCEMMIGAVGAIVTYCY